MFDRVDIQIRNLQRELAALKRGMYGGARSYFDTTATSHSFSVSSSGNKKITLSFARPDFPMLFATVTPDGANPLAGYVVQRTGRYEWTVFLDPELSLPVAIDCTCTAEQVPTWELS